MIDAHYTPEDVASELLASLPPTFAPRRIADFAGGDGALLEAAADAFPKASIYYNDVDSDAALDVQRRHPDWTTSRSNFLDLRAAAAAHYSRVERGFDLVLLNPPFSQRGVAPTCIRHNRETFHCSVALAFVIRSLRYLANDGRLLAVLPLGCLDRLIDRHAWKILSKEYYFEEMGQLSSFTFSSARARTTLVSIRRSSAPRSKPRVNSVLTPKLGSLIRGAYQMHFPSDSAGGTSWPLVHTANLQDGMVDLSGPRVEWRNIVEGPALLFPRVGAITTGKVALLAAGVKVILSDCVFAVLCTSETRVRGLRGSIIRDWELFEMLYGGTGAPYTTREKVERYLMGRSLGVIRPSVALLSPRKTEPA